MNEEKIKVFAESASNLALIKYMGKKEDKKITKELKNFLKGKDLSFLSHEDKDRLFFKNQALNPSLSLRLNHFKSYVEIKEDRVDGCKGMHGFILSSKDQERFLDFFQFFKKTF